MNDYSLLILCTILVCLYVILYAVSNLLNKWHEERRIEYLRNRRISRKMEHWCHRSDYENLLFEYRNK